MRQTHGTILTQHVFIGSRNSEAVCRPPAVLRTLGALNPRKDTHLLICRLLFAVCGRAGIAQSTSVPTVRSGRFFSDFGDVRNGCKDFPPTQNLTSVTERHEGRSRGCIKKKSDKTVSENSPSCKICRLEWGASWENTRSAHPMKFSPTERRTLWTL